MLGVCACACACACACVCECACACACVCVCVNTVYVWHLRHEKIQPKKSDAHHSSLALKPCVQAA